MTGTVDANRELAVFLRTRRERLRPKDVALPERGRARRTPGLRREEVAELAGVSVDYVVRLEQGRGLRPSPEVLDALADALRLSGDERAYLFDLAQQRPSGARRTFEQAADPVARLVRDLSPLPCMLLNHRFDILAWNDEMSALMLDLEAVPAPQRNALVTARPGRDRPGRTERAAAAAGALTLPESGSSVVVQPHVRAVVRGPRAEQPLQQRPPRQFEFVTGELEGPLVVLGQGLSWRFHVAESARAR